MVSLGKYSIAIFSAGFLLGINKTLQFLVYKSPSTLKKIINKTTTTLQEYVRRSNKSKSQPVSEKSDMRHLT